MKLFDCPILFQHIHFQSKLHNDSDAKISVASMHISPLQMGCFPIETKKDMKKEPLLHVLIMI